MKLAHSALFFLALIALPSPSYACECPHDPASTIEMRMANLPPHVAVFSGQAVRVTEVSNNYEVEFRVASAWRGVSTPSLEIRGSLQLCGFAFEQGREYLVFADPRDTHFVASACRDTTFLQDAAPILRLLGPPTYRADQVSQPNGSSTSGD